MDRALLGWQVPHMAPVLVNTSGAWGARLARAVGEEIPLGFSALMMIYTSAVPPFVTPVVGLTGRPMSFKQAPTGHVMIGGGHLGIGDLDTGSIRLDVTRLAYSADTAMSLFPILKQAKLVHAWAGLEGRLPDEIPVIGLSRAAPELVHAFGFCGHGFELGPVMGGIVAQLAIDGSTNWPIAPFAPDRFESTTGGHRNPDQGCSAGGIARASTPACLLQPGQCQKLPVRFREEFRAPRGVRKSPRNEPAGRRRWSMGISVFG